MWLYLFSVCSHWSNGTFPMTHCFPKFATCCCQVREALTWTAVAVNEWDFFFPFPFSPFNWTLLLMDHLMQFRWEPFLVLLKKWNLNRLHLLQSYVDLYKCKICWAALCLLIRHSPRTTFIPGKCPVRCALLAILVTLTLNFPQNRKSSAQSTCFPSSRRHATLHGI